MKKQHFGTMLVFFAAVSYSLGGLGIKLIENWSAMSINGGRTMIGAVVVALYMLFSRHKFRMNRYVLLGALCVAGTNILFALANKLTTAANTIVLQYTAPFFVILFSWLFWRKKPKKLDVIACIIVFLGVLCFVADSLEMGGAFGNILALLSGITYAGVFLLNDMPDGDAISSVLVGLLISTVVGLPYLLQETSFPMQTLLCILVLGVVQVGLAFIFLAVGTRYTPAVTASLVSGIEPILNPILVAIFHPSEKIGTMALVGTVVVLGAVLTYNVLKEKLSIK